MILHTRKFRIIPYQGDPRTFSKKKKKVALGETISKIVHKKKKIYIYIYIYFSV